MSIHDVSGREQIGCEGDYLVECSDGSRRIAPRHIFEDIYVELEAGEASRTFSVVRGLRKLEHDDPRQAALFSRTG